MSETATPAGVPASASAPFGRMLTAMVTPMTTSGAVDYDGAARLADYLVTDMWHDRRVADDVGRGEETAADRGPGGRRGPRHGRGWRRDKRHGAQLRAGARGRGSRCPWPAGRDALLQQTTAEWPGRPFHRRRRRDWPAEPAL